MPKLFKVTATMTFLLAEDSESAARGNAIPYGREHMGDAMTPFDSLVVEEITSVDQIPKGWGSAIPYGDESDGDLTCRAILNQ